MESNELQDRALKELRRALKEESRFVKLHAAEALLTLGYSSDVLEVFEKECELHSNVPQYRIAVWRVLARAGSNKQERETYTNKIRDAYLDPSAPDRANSAEALAKLQFVIPKKDLPEFKELAQDATEKGVQYRRWLVAVTGGEDNIRWLAELLDNPDAAVRGHSAYALRFLADKLPPDVVAKLLTNAEREPESEYRVNLLTAASVATHDEKQSQRFKELLLPYAKSAKPEDRYELAASLSLRGTDSDLPLLSALLNDPEADVRVSAANAILRIDRRKPLPFTIVDWLVVAGYGTCMLAIGWHFARRSKSTDDYLLAGRNMPPWAVGLSYFAGMFSTISYLAFPGEMIRHGPMILSLLLAYPLIFLVVSRLMIPYIMRLEVTSAYEILEKRFGLSVRMLGSTFFIIMRLVWMSFIIFATSKHVLVPLLRLDDSAAAWVAIVLGMVTVVYTSMGGLRAVIWTDVAQAFILMFGAILSIVLISISLGGPAAWWPSTWDSNWEPAKFGFDPTARVTMASAVLSTFIWYVCTAGSDQMAIQRYLATRDVSAARRMLGISLWFDAFVTFLLGALGLALFAYFQSNPRMLPDGYTVLSGADRLLPQFIVKGLPAGISGLVVAGLLAAAMSSLSSGLSSSCSVITVDWIDRFRKTRLQESDHVRLARSVSWIVGTVIVALSFTASIVQGNLLEAASKLVNLLTAPLFVLFFMAMFVRWATALGTWAAGISSVIAAVVIAYTDVTHLSFLWIMPVSLLTGILVGCLVSLIPCGQRRPMLKVSAELESRAAAD